MSSTTSRWRARATGAVAGLGVAALVVGSSAFASGDRAPTAPAAAKARHACDAPSMKRAARAEAPSAGSGSGPFLAAVAELARAGTITDAQAQVLDADIRAGSIDPQQLVASGTLSAAQMQTVGDRLAAVKRSLAPAGQGGAGPGAGQAKAPQG
jgi:hypothetical protein